MKPLKIFLISIISIIIIIYLSFLFVFPNLVDLNQYSPQITKAVKDATGFEVQLKGLKVKTAWNLSAGASVDKIDLSYPNGTKFAQVNDFQVRLSLLPLFIGQVRVDKIEIDRLMLNLDVKKDGKFLIEEFIPKNPQKTQEKQPLKFSDKMPDILVNSYRISVVDLNTGKKYSQKGQDFEISDFIMNKKIKVATKGELELDGKKQISYDINLFSTLFSQVQPSKSEETYPNVVKIFEQMRKYNLLANINVNLKLTGSFEEPHAKGNVYVDGLSLAINSKQFPPSRIHLDFNRDKIKINSNLYIDSDCKAKVSGEIKNGKKKYVDLHVQSDRIELQHAVSILDTLLKSVGKNDLNGVKAGGLLAANFDIKSDFKKIQSRGYLNVSNASIYLSQYKSGVNAINANVDFSNNLINIKHASAKLGNQPLLIKGKIDHSANADISIIATNASVKELLIMSGNSGLLKENDILGLVDINATLKGRLDKAVPSAKVDLSSLNVYNKPSKTRIKVANVIVDAYAGKKIEGILKLNSLTAYQGSSAIASLPSLVADFTDKELIIHSSALYISGIRTSLEGKIVDLNKPSPRFSNFSVSVPKQSSMSVQGFANSVLTLKGAIELSGTLDNPIISGGFSIPLIKLPSISTTIRNAELSLGKNYSISCPHILVGNSLMSFDSDISKDFSQGLVLTNASFNSRSVDLDSIGSAFSKMPQGGASDLGITISGGKLFVDRFKTGNLVATSISSSMSLKNNVMYLNDLNANAYNGVVKGIISYNIINGKTTINVSGRGLSANPALTALSGRNDNIIGVLDFDSNISMKGATEREILNSLNGTTDFIISNGQMGVLGKFEHLLYAQNILSNNILKASLNVVAKALSLKNTGVYKYMKGKIRLSNGWANIDWIKTSGPSMSLYITGRYYLPGNKASFKILGRISDDIVKILGPIGEFSVDRAISSIPKIGPITSLFLSQFTTSPNYENVDLIPELSPQTQFGTREFRVIIDGDIQKQNAVKSFKWISRATAATPTESSSSTTYQSPKELINKYKTNINQQYTQVKKQIPTSVPDFVNKLPNLLN